MKLLVQLIVMLGMIGLLVQMPISVVLHRFSSGTVFPGLEAPVHAFPLMVRVAKGSSPLWYRAANVFLLGIDLLVLLGLAAYPAHLLGRRGAGDHRPDR
ncbi:MAG TPA: hypothetical protein PKO06_17255 [Candidatus Ozemobacteraceae bacterium]|nr:hypothetical protein [Candidatus Ozemobacteraceae bacterium]